MSPTDATQRSVSHHDSFISGERPQRCSLRQETVWTPAGVCELSRKREREREREEKKVLAMNPNAVILHYTNPATPAPSVTDVPRYRSNVPTKGKSSLSPDLANSFTLLEQSVSQPPWIAARIRPLAICIATLGVKWTGIDITNVTP
jgi:hypothetical protein